MEKLSKFHPEYQSKKYWERKKKEWAISEDQIRHKSAIFRVTDFVALTEERKRKCLNYFGHQCAVCRTPSKFLEMDHWIPRSIRGSDGMENLVPLCQTCNVNKCSRDVEEWLFSEFDPEHAEAVLEKVWRYFQWVKRCYVHNR